MLLNLVHTHDQGTQFLLGEILNFIYEESEGDFPISGSLTYGDEEVRQIHLQIATIC